MGWSRQALLLRVGMDRGTGGVLAPIFRDGTFEYLPIPETVPTRLPLTYATLPGRHIPSLASLIPPHLAQRHPHMDPYFETATYGDAAAGKRRQLSRLAPGDRLVFYAGLAPSPPEDRARLFAIGSFRVATVHQLRGRDINRSDLQERLGGTAHFLRRIPDDELVLVEGSPGESRRFDRAIPLGDGHDCMLEDLAVLGYRGSLLRSVGHWIRGETALRGLDMWLGEGPVSLVGKGAHLIQIALPDLSYEHGDLVIDDPRPNVGDWVVIGLDGGIQTLARVNRIENIDGKLRAASSLYWHFISGPAPHAAARDLGSEGGIDGAALRRVISSLAARYRIGVHQTEI